MPIKSLISYFNQYLPLDEEEAHELEKRAVKRKVKRRQYILAAGETCKHYNFVVEGCFKMYKVDEAAKEHNIMFAVENEWITDIGSFHSEKPSQLYIEAVEPAEIIQISKLDLLLLYTNHLKFNRTFRVIIEDQFVEVQNRLLQTISTTAEERYTSFLQDYPHLINRLSNAQIASYIGITPEFLSRIRSQQVGK
jgi:CRP-like cAMP-binding protein